MQHKGKRKWQSFLFLKGVKGEQLAEKGGGGQGCWVTRHHAEEMVPLVSSIFGTCWHCFATSADDASVCMLVPGNMQIWRVWRRDRCAFPFITL